jgi:hypothetical protein
MSAVDNRRSYWCITYLFWVPIKVQRREGKILERERKERKERERRRKREEIEME